MIPYSTVGGVTADVYRNVQTQELHEATETFAPRPREDRKLLGEGQSPNEPSKDS